MANKEIFEALCREKEGLFLAGGTKRSLQETQESINAILDLEICKQQVESNPSINESYR